MIAQFECPQRSWRSPSSLQPSKPRSVSPIRKPRNYDPTLHLVTIDLDQSQQPSPVHRLPPEVVTEIFLQYIPHYPHRPRLRDFEESPLALTGICGRWRKIALSSPILWKAVEIAESAYTTDEDRLTQLIKMFLNRSGSSTLSIELAGPARNYLVGAILPYMNRVEHFKTSATQSILAALEGKLTEVITLEISGYTTGFGASYPVALLKNTSKVQFLSLDSISLISREMHISLQGAVPWNQLHSLALTSFAFQTCYRILQYTPNLSFCWLEIPANASTNTGSIWLPHLKALVLEISLPPLPDVFLDMFTLPALERLQTETHLLQWNLRDQLQGLLERSRYGLKELRIVAESTVMKPQMVLDDLQSIVPHMEVVDYKPTSSKLAWPERLA
uniref:F-box domain-containing protein n=1 Tax=Mycena chlorophos TaxID=658473 RepID=A0ABQ0L3N9_MYCCL|nr:predicted protein [Mycena chlorophos]